MQLIEVNNKKSLHEFTMLPFKLYKGNKAWVPPIISEYKKYVSGYDNNLNTAGPHILFIVQKKGNTVGRILAGMDNRLNDYKGLKDGYISQFECVEDYNIAKIMLDKCCEWLKENGANRIKGPLSLPGGEDNRGFLINNFENMTYIMNTYNKPYYNDFFVKYGFEKYHDCFAFESALDAINMERYERLVPLAMKRYKFTIDQFDLKNVNKESQDIKHIIQSSLPEEWEDFMPLNDDDIQKTVNQLIEFLDDRIVFIARNLEGKPIGFNIALPDYNQVLSELNGKLFPFGFLKFLFRKKKINRLRTFVLFVVPEYRQKGVSSAIYLQTYINAQKAGYKSIEGSTIWEYNKPMLADIFKTGAKISKTYRIYKLPI